MQQRSIQIRLLGPVEVLVDGEQLDLSPAQRRVIALLALKVGESVPVEEFRALFPTTQPAEPPSVSEIATMLTGPFDSWKTGLDLVLPIRSEHGGFLLDLPRDAIDAHRFLDLRLNDALELSDMDQVRALADALELWRGPALADIELDDQNRQRLVGHLEDARLACSELKFAAQLRLGHAPDVLLELAKLLAEFPFRERLVELRMQALRATGREAEAISVYDEFRRTVAESLDVEPGPDLRNLRQQIIETTAGLTAAAEHAQSQSRSGNSGSTDSGLERPQVRELVEFFSRAGTEQKVAQLVGTRDSGKRSAAIEVFSTLQDDGVYNEVVWIDAGHAPIEPGGPPDRLLVVRHADHFESDELAQFLALGLDTLLMTRSRLQVRSGCVVDIAPLSGDEARALLESWNFEGDTKNIVAIAQGSPRLLELLAHLTRLRDDALTGLSPGPAPTDLIYEVFHRYPQSIQRLLARSTLLDSRDALTAETVSALLDCDAATADDVLSAAGPLVEPGPDGTYVFNEDLIREAARMLAQEEDTGAMAGTRDRLVHWRAGRHDGSPRSHLARDYWTTDDVLDYRAYAQAVATFIRHPDTRPPITIGVKGPWGAGKTSFMRMLQAELDPRHDASDHGERMLELQDADRKDRTTVSDVLELSRRDPQPDKLKATPTEQFGQSTEDWRPTVWFNPWMYQSGEQVWAGLAHEIIRQITDRLKPVDRERFWLRLNLARVDGEVVRGRILRALLTRLLPFLLGFLGLAAVFTVILLAQVGTTFGAYGLIGSFLVSATGAGVQAIRFLDQNVSRTFGELVREPMGTIVQDPAYKSKAGFLHLVHTDMRRVLDLVATEDRPVVVFVDDLDRCTPGTVSQVIEAVNLFLAGEFPNCVFIIAMEPEVVAAHVQVTYKELVEQLPPDVGRDALGWRFLEKIVQLPLTLPPLEDTHRKGYIRSLLGIPPDAPPQTTAAPEQVPAVPNTPPAQQAYEPEVAMPVVVSQRPPTAPTRAPMKRTKAPAPPRPAIDIDRAATEIRRRRPTLDTIAAIAREVQADVFHVAGNLEPAMSAAYERVFGELYSDQNSHEALEAALGHLDAGNPREVKRYVNVFRFYTFIAHRQRVDTTQTVDRTEVAKLAALVIRFPDLLGCLMSRDSDGRTALHNLEVAARESAWPDEHQVDDRLSARREALQAFFADGPPIAGLASRLL